MAQRDENEEAVGGVENAGESDPIPGKDSLDSPDLKRKREDARKALRPELPTGQPSGDEPVEQA